MDKRITIQKQLAAIVTPNECTLQLTEKGVLASFVTDPLVVDKIYAFAKKHDLPARAFGVVNIEIITDTVNKPKTISHEHTPAYATA